MTPGAGDQSFPVADLGGVEWRSPEGLEGCLRLVPRGAAAGAEADGPGCDPVPGAGQPSVTRAQPDQDPASVVFGLGYGPVHESLPFAAAVLESVRRTQSVPVATAPVPVGGARRDPADIAERIRHLGDLHQAGHADGGRPRRGSGAASLGARPARLSASRRMTSICALTDRSSSSAQRATASLALATVRHGRTVRVGGLVVARQRPGTAKGIVFMLVEDEGGTINLIVPADVYERHRLASGQRDVKHAQRERSTRLAARLPFVPGGTAQCVDA